MSLGIALGLPFSPQDSVNVLKRLGAVWAIDAAESKVGEQKAVNIGTGGSVLDAQYGSTTGVDTNDPTLLPWTGENYLYNSGDASTVSIPSGASVNVGTTTFIVKCKFFSITGATRAIFSKSDSVNQCSYELLLASDTRLFFRIWTDGTIATQIDSATTNPAPFSVGVTYWIKVERFSSTGATQFSYAADSPTEPTVWTNLTTTSGALGTPFSGTAPLLISSRTAGVSPLLGEIYYIRQYDPNAPTVTRLLVDFRSQKNQASFVCGTGQTVTLNRAATGKKLTMVTRPTWLFGTNDYLEVADNALLDFDANDNGTFITLVRQFSGSEGFGAILSKGGSGVVGPGWCFAFQGNGSLTAYMDMGDGTLIASNSAQPLGRTSGGLNMLGTIRNTSVPALSKIGVSSGNASISGNQADASARTTSNALVMRVGANQTPGNFADMEVFAAAIFRRVLTLQELSQIVSYYGAS